MIINTCNNDKLTFLDNRSYFIDLKIIQLLLQSIFELTATTTWDVLKGDSVTSKPIKGWVPRSTNALAITFSNIQELSLVHVPLLMFHNP